MAIGIIAEYNPFHNGHLYHLNKIKSKYPNEEIVLVLSGNYTQRGELSIIEKYNKAKIALENGVDLVVELPFAFATQSADVFAQGALEILNHLKCDKLIFGSESNDIEKLISLANIQLQNKEYSTIVKQELEKGINYPTAMSNALKQINNTTVTESNDLLGLSYIKQIIQNNYDIIPISIKRTNNYNDIQLTGGIDSATSIRHALKNNLDISQSVPPITKKFLVPIDEQQYFQYLKYKILSDNTLKNYQTVDEGIENRITHYLLETNTLEELIEKIKTKRYTYNKITRMLTHILCSFTKEERAKHPHINYIRILGFSKKGQHYLHKMKKNIQIPIITNINKNNIKYLELELRCDAIYHLITKNTENLFAKKPMIKDN